MLVCVWVNMRLIFILVNKCNVVFVNYFVLRCNVPIFTSDEAFISRMAADCVGVVVNLSRGFLVTSRL